MPGAVSPTVLFEDDWLIAVDKPSGMAVHGGAGINEPTLNEWVREYLGARAVRNDFTASVAHRLDRETSGVVLVAKRRPAMRALAGAFEGRRVRKRYIALVRGAMRAPAGRIEAPVIDNDRSVAALTSWSVAEVFPGTSLLHVSPETGRKHQIRQHLSQVGNPIACDDRYGDSAFNARLRQRLGLTRLFLHASWLEFQHPQSNRRMEVASPLPQGLESVLRQLRAEQPPEPAPRA